MIVFHTESGSVYEVDETNKRARRAVAGSKETWRATVEWREYDEILTGIEIGKPAIFVWTTETDPLPGSPNDVVRMTITSRVTSKGELN